VKDQKDSLKELFPLETLRLEKNLKVESQGRLPNSLTVEKIKAGQKYPRNPIMV
jgi:hypothetical protein